MKSQTDRLTIFTAIIILGIYKLSKSTSLVFFKHNFINKKNRVLSDYKNFKKKQSLRLIEVLELQYYNKV